MNVTFVAPFGLRQKTTVWARTLPLAQELVRAGHQATILIPPWDSRADAGRTWDEEGVALVNVPLTGGAPAVVRRLVRALEARHPDIVHIVKPRAHAGLVHWWLNRRGQAGPIVLDIDDWEQAWAPVNGYPWPLARFLAWQEEWGIRHAGAITAASRWLEGRAHAYAPATPVLYLPNGVRSSAAPASPRIPPDPPVVLFYSRYVEVSPAWLAAFWTALAAEIPNARLVVAGSPLQPGREHAFQAAVQQLAPGVSDGITWPGFIPPAQQDALYAAATCAIFPARPEPLQEAKCSVRLATTLLNGVPVVASAVGEQANYGANGAARLLPAGAAPAAFATATADLLRAPADQQTMVRQAAAHLRTHYDWQRLGTTLMEFYGSLLDSRR